MVRAAVEESVLATALEELNRSLVLLCRCPGFKGAQVAALSGLGVLFSGIEPIPTRSKFAYHPPTSIRLLVFTGCRLLEQPLILRVQIEVALRHGCCRPHHRVITARVGCTGDPICPTAHNQNLSTIDPLVRHEEWGRLAHAHDPDHLEPDDVSDSIASLPGLIQLIVPDDLHPTWTITEPGRYAALMPECTIRQLRVYQPPSGDRGLWIGGRLPFSRSCREQAGDDKCEVRAHLFRIPSSAGESLVLGSSI
jgi:hypothetical protein